MKNKKMLSMLLSVTMLAGTMGSVNAETYEHTDTISSVSGVEVFKDSVSGWISKYQIHQTTTSLYLTHAAYEGNAAMLVEVAAGGLADTANNSVYKASEDFGIDHHVVEGDQYKIEFYEKPLTGTLCENIRYYPEYTGVSFTAYDAETGEAAGSTVENKWYKLVSEFTANAAMARQDAGVGVAFLLEPGTYLFDDVKMYHKVNGEWILMANGTGVFNGNFEEGVVVSKGIDPTDVSVVAGLDSATISWINPQEQETRIYNGDELVATAAAGETSVTITGLDANINYTFTVKGVLNNIESSGVDVLVELLEPEYPDTIKSVSGVEVFKDSVSGWISKYQIHQTTTSLYLTHAAYEGNAAMLVEVAAGGLADTANNSVYKASEDFGIDHHVVEGDQYKIEFYEKPLTGTLCENIRYYPEYTGVSFTAYDAETGEAAGSTVENKWYKLVSEFTANAAMARQDAGVGVAFLLEPGTYLFDNVKMYHKVNGEWVLMANGTGVFNGNFEEGVQSISGVEPENVTVENKMESVVIRWSAPTNQAVNVYNGDELLATAAAGETSIIIENLTADTEYTFVVKGVGLYSESNGVEVKAFPFGKLGDTIKVMDGIEVFKDSVNGWISEYQIHQTTTSLYLTHAAYEGNAAMLVEVAAGGIADTANNSVYKASEDFGTDHHVVEGDQYKIEFYEKPLTGTLCENIRYYPEYTGVSFTAYDAETGEAAGSTVENKWYKLVSEFTANAAMARQDAGVGVAFLLEPGTYLFDDVKMYHKVNGEWVLMANGTGVFNGNFEEGVTGDEIAPDEVENLQATAGNASVVLSWDAVKADDLDRYSIYNGNELIADVARNITSYKVTGLTNDVKVTLTVKAYDRTGNASEGTSVSVTPTIPVYETTDYVAGNKIVSGLNTISVKITNNKDTDGMTAQLIIGLYDKDTDALMNATATDIVPVALGKTEELSKGINVENLAAANYEIRAFLWESLSGVLPLKGALIITE